MWRFITSALTVVDNDINVLTNIIIDFRNKICVLSF